MSSYEGVDMSEQENDYESNGKFPLKQLFSLH